MKQGKGNTVGGGLPSEGGTGEEGPGGGSLTGALCTGFTLVGQQNKHQS